MTASNSTSSIQRYGTLGFGIAIWVILFLSVTQARLSAQGALVMLVVFGGAAIVAMALSHTKAIWWLLLIGIGYVVLGVGVGSSGDDDEFVFALTSFLAGVWFILVPFLPRFAGRD